MALSQDPPLCLQLLAKDSGGQVSEANGASAEPAHCTGGYLLSTVPYGDRHGQTASSQKAILVFKLTPFLGWEN